MIDDQKTPIFTEKKKESLFTAIYIGALFIILAVVYFSNQNIFSDIVDFFSTLTLAEVPGAGFPLPAPAEPAAHLSIYTAAFQFSIAIGVLEIIILALRVIWHSPVARKAETIENIVFWLGASYLVAAYLVNMTIQSEWFVFWAGIILIFGLSLLARSFVLLANRR